MVNVLSRGGGLILTTLLLESCIAAHGGVTPSQSALEQATKRYEQVKELVPGYVLLDPSDSATHDSAVDSNCYHGAHTGADSVDTAYTLDTMDSGAVYVPDPSCFDSGYFQHDTAVGQLNSAQTGVYVTQITRETSRLCSEGVSGLAAQLADLDAAHASFDVDPNVVPLRLGVENQYSALRDLCYDG